MQSSHPAHPESQDPARTETPGEEPALEVRGLRYAYPGTTKPVLEDLDFDIGPGEIFGFLGPNGSGKSTTQKLLTRILVGWSGEARVLGRDLRTASADYFNHIGVCFEFPNLYEKLTAEENLEFYRGFFDVPTDSAADLLARLDLPPGDRRPVGQYSRGMKMRVVIARSLLNRPRFWFLDEPTAGQDPQHAVLVRDLIRERAATGASVFLTTHDMTVADQLCDRVAFLVGGHIAAVDSPHRLKLARSGRVARVEYAPDGDGGVTTRDFDLADADGKRAFLEQVAAHRIETIHTLEPSLEDVFLDVTGRELS
jgi:fluoroquinolone transport system ATP-binding protein